jgi:hypothetical protein
MSSPTRAPDDALDQVRGARGRAFREDRGHAAEGGITGWHHVRPRRAVDLDRRQRAVVADPDAPRVEEHAGQITDVVHVKVGEEHRFQPREVESRVGEGGGRPAAAVDDEAPPVDDERR